MAKRLSLEDHYGGCDVVVFPPPRDHASKRSKMANHSRKCNIMTLS
ncbi:hypothetical protein BVRB_2g028400 isoform B [Beta vulgaris subsp. vulgaris]|nr:hypothetical protein BVRB_2g028400 isoform B [Beta vulgaris subsp. vulgaris]